MIRIPYGISNFGELRRKGSYYVDRTSYIEVLEAGTSAEYVFFLRPRRFGKSLWISTLQHYYGVEYKDDFQPLFGDLYIGQNPTPNANNYLVLRLNFSGINTENPDKVEKMFLGKLRRGVLNFLSCYSGSYFPRINQDWVYEEESPSGLLNRFLEALELIKPPHKIYVLIDEYDHFANKLLVSGKKAFLGLVGGNGFVRTFYEVLKEGTESIVERLFITGVSPLTIDSLSSGFNIASNLTNDYLFHDMLGFREEEVIELLKQLGFTDQTLTDI